MLKRWLSGALCLVLVFGLFVILPQKANAATVLTSSDAFIDVLKKMEGFSSKPYWDYSQYTVGYGTKCPDDKLEEYQKNGITKAEAEELLRKELNKAETAINDYAATYDLVFTQNEFDALVSFTYNCGAGWTKESTGYFNTAVRSGDKSNALLYGLCLWSTAGGEYILIDRRMCEANMYINGEYRAPNSSGELYPDNFRWVFLNGNGGETRYKIYAYDADNPQPVEISFASTPTGTDKDGKSFTYTFAGWYTDDGKKVELLDDSLERGETLYARWKDPDGKVTSLPNGQSVGKVPVVVTGTEVNVRSGPGTEYSIVTTVSQGQALTVTEIYETSRYTWGKTELGWISLSYTNYGKEPIITAQPVNVTEPDGDKITIQVQAVGTNLSYQWYFAKKGSTKFSKSSITKNVYTATMSESRDGRQVYCLITDKDGNSVKSKTVSMHMGKTPTFTTQPKSAKAAIGSAVTVQVKASGEDLSYQWYYCDRDSDTFKKASVTTAKYKVTMSAARHGRKLYCVITDKFASKATSEVVTISSTSAVITQQPSDTTVTKGETAVAKVQAAGEGLTYQWYVRNAGGKRFSKSSINKATYTTTMGDKQDGRQVYCVVTDKNGTCATSKTVTLSMDKRMYIIRQPATVMAPRGYDATVQVLANGKDLSYRWYICNPGKTTFSKSSVTTDTYTAEMNDSRDGRQLYCVITDASGKKLTTSTVSMHMDKSLFITRQPKDAAAAEGEIASVKVAANGEGLHYKWYIRNAGNKSFSVSAITEDTYSIKMSDARNGRQAYCVITDAQGNSVTSETVTFTMHKKLEILTQPKGVTVAEGKTATVTVTADGDGLTYQWFYCNAGSEAFQKSSITTDTYTATMNEKRNGRQVYCVVTDAYGSTLKSNIVTIRMRAKLQIVTQPKSVVVEAGEKATVTVAAVGDGLTYQWYIRNAGKKTFVASSVKGPTYSITMSEKANGRQAYCIITDAYGNTVTTRTVTLSRQ